MFENLIDRLEGSFRLLKGEGKITEINVAETLKEVRKALLDADVSYKVAKEFCDRGPWQRHSWQSVLDPSLLPRCKQELRPT